MRALLFSLLFFAALPQLHLAHVPSDNKQEDPWVEVAYCGAKAQKPPLEKLLFDVSLHNPSQEQVWILLPQGFYERPTKYSKDAGVEAIQVLTGEQHQVKLVSFFGRARIQPEVANDAGGFQGFLLPVGGKVIVHHLAIDFWGRPNGALPITAVIARRVVIGGKAVEHRVRTPLASKTNAAPEHLSIVDSWHTKDWGEVPVVITRTGQFSVDNALAKRCIGEPINNGT